MSDRIYNWKRFWCPRGATINLSDGGYLYDPDSQWGRIYNPEVKPFEAISETPCLALLGEPGIGKTRTIEAEREGAETRIKQEGDDILWLDLRSYGSEDRLVRNLFESEKFLAWIRGSHRLHVFLDSLDEGLLRIDTLAALLAEEFKRYPVERLYLRIACRTAEWPSSLEAELQQLWGEKAVGVYELVPLRRRDVVEAAKANALDPDAFLAEIYRAEVTPLAIKPVTLDFLLSTYQRHGSLPKTQAELYLEGCRLLCEETNKDRRAARLTGDLSADQRLAVAARIAAVSIFANRYAVWTTVDQGEVPEEDVTVRELSSGREQARSDEFEVTEDAVREALGTGLFSARGPNRLGWAHQTYAEFLAAYYLKQHQMTLTQRMSLIVHPGDPEKKLIPQLHETAAWLAGIVPEVFREIVKSDPEVLLRSDVATAEVKDRVALVGALLERCDKEQSLVRHDWGMFERYKKLLHPGLAEQLQPYIYDSTKSQLARLVAIDVTEACDLQILQDDLVEIALDLSQPLQIRVDAARTVARIGDNEVKARLKPLACGEAGDDPDDELKGCGLQAVWPSCITAEELFGLLTFPKNEALYGIYGSFLLNDLVPYLQPDDLPPVLKWVGGLADGLSSVHPFERLADSILLRVWEHLNVPEVLEEFAQVVLERLKNYQEIVKDRTDSPFRKFLNENEEKRRRLLETMLHMLTEAEEDTFVLLRSDSPLVLANDIPWMIDHLRASMSEKVQRAWSQLIERIFDWREPGQTDSVLIACQENPILAEVFARLLKPVEIDSPEAQEMKARYLRIQEWQNKKESRPLLDPPPAERIAALLNKCESGDLSAWWQLNRELTLESDGPDYGDELESDLTALPGWKVTEPATRRRIIEVAKRYLLEQTPETSKWFGTNIFYRPAFAGYRALRLLLQEDPSWATTISPEVWKKWSPIIIAHPVSNGPEKTEPHRELVKKAYKHAASEIIEYLIVLIDKENERHGDIFILREVEGCWDVRLTSALLAKLKDESLKPLALGRLLGDLLDHKVEETKAFAETLLTLPPHAHEEQQSNTTLSKLKVS